MSLPLTALVGLGVAAAVALGATRASAASPDPALRRELEAVAKLKVFFGHQSVGANVLEGLGRLAAGQGVPLNVVEVRGAEAVTAPAFAHAKVGANMDPSSKLAGFDRALGPAAKVDVALVKFCYVDVTEATDVAALFARYQETVRAVRARHPGTAIVHVTTPLVAAQGGWKGAVKKLLGRGKGAANDNLRREELNALVRQAYQGKEPLFDLARVESTRPDGGAEVDAWGGKEVRFLVPSYTQDGEHLAGEAQERAARELVRVLAALPAAR